MLALIDYLEDPTQPEGLIELIKNVVNIIIRKVFGDPTKYGNEAEDAMLGMLFQHMCNLAEQLCNSRETLRNSSDFHLKVQSLDSLAFHLHIVFVIMKLSGPFISEKSPLFAILSNQFCPLLHKV